MVGGQLQLPRRNLFYSDRRQYNVWKESLPLDWNWFILEPSMYRLRFGSLGFEVSGDFRGGYVILWCWLTSPKTKYSTILPPNLPLQRTKINRKVHRTKMIYSVRKYALRVYQFNCGTCWIEQDRAWSSNLETADILTRLLYTDERIKSTYCNFRHSIMHKIIEKYYIVQSWMHKFYED